MVPTTYSGDAIIDGERLPAVLHLNSDSVMLELDTQEVLRWPLGGLDVEPGRKGSYELRYGSESFSFEPSVDDGLHEELQLRRRFQDDPAAPTDPPAPTVTLAETARQRANRAAGPSILEGRDLRPRTALILIVALAAIVLAVAAVSGVFDSQPTTVVVDPDLTIDPETAPGAAPASSVPPTTLPAPVTTEVSAPTDPTVAGATVTTTPPTTAPPTTSPPTTSPGPPAAFEMTPDEFVSAWNALIARWGTGLTASDVSVEGGRLTFRGSDYVEVEAATGGDGTLTSVLVSGDPSGPPQGDADILTAIGAVIELVERDDSPERRRDLVTELGFDIENPSLEELDGSVVREGVAFSLRWDPEMQRMLFGASEA